MRFSKSAFVKSGLSKEWLNNQHKPGQGTSKIGTKRQVSTGQPREADVQRKGEARFRLALPYSLACSLVTPECARHVGDLSLCGSDPKFHQP